MFERIKNFKAKEWLIIIISTLLLTDLIVILNIPILREISTFLCFTFIPGMIILQIFKLNKIEFIKKFVLWVGLSVTFLMFGGLFLNSLYPLILAPLSLGPVLVSFNIILILLAFWAYKRNKDDFHIKDVFNFKVNIEDKLISPLIFSLLFPFMAVFGTYLMNAWQNNIILLGMLFLIPAYIVVIIYLGDRIHDATYPFSLWMIGMSLLLMHGLTSYHLIGRDIHGEFYCFQLTLSDFHWSISKYYNNFNTCLSIVILPTVYKVLTNMKSEYIFKLLFGLIGSIIPLIIYLVTKKYIANKYAFLASLLFIFQMFFMEILGCTRQEIAIIFSFLAILILLDSKLDKLSAKILFLIFMLSSLLSHYATIYVSFALILPILFIPFFKSLFIERKIIFKNFDVIIPLFVFTFLWYNFVAQVQLAVTSNVIALTAGGLTGTTTGTKNDAILAVLGIGLNSTPEMISAIVHDAIFATIGIGLITLLWRYRFYKKKIGIEYMVGGFISAVLLVSFVVIPNISQEYGPPRLFLQVLIFLAPIFVIGAKSIAKIIKKPKWDVKILLVLLISLFLCTTHLQYHFFGIPSSTYYDNSGKARDEYYIYDQEIVAAEWLNKYGLKDSKIYTDIIGPYRLMYGYNQNIRNIKINSTFYWRKIPIQSGYIYLGYVNAKKRIVFKSFETPMDIEKFLYLFVGKNRVYDNDYAEIWR